MRIRRNQMMLMGGLLAFGGCASGGGDDAAPAPRGRVSSDQQVALEITNNLLRPRVALTIRIRAPGRTIKTLGTVQADQTRTFIVEGSDLTAGWVIIASRQGRDLMVSRRLTTTGGSIVRWDLNADRLTTDDLQR